MLCERHNITWTMATDRERPLLLTALKPVPVDLTKTRKSHGFRVTVDHKLARKTKRGSDGIEQEAGTRWTRGEQRKMGIHKGLLLK